MGVSLLVIFAISLVIYLYRKNKMVSNTRLDQDQIGYTPRVAIIGDSLVQQHNLQGLNWTEQVTAKYQQVGGFSKFFNLGISASTFYRAINSNQYRQGTTTQLQELIRYRPDYVVVTLGFNDLINPDAVDNRTLAQVKQDATDFVAAVRAAIPGVVIVWGAVAAFDRAQTATLKNKHVIPFKFNLASYGIYANCYSDEMLESNITSAHQTCFNNWRDFYSTMQGLFDSTFIIELWRIARLGCLPDGLHPDALGANLYAGYVLKGLTTLYPAVFTKIENSFATWTDPDSLFNGTLEPYYDGYATRTTSLLDQKQLFDWYSKNSFCPDAWFFPYRASVISPHDFTSNGTGNFYFASIRGAKPMERVYVSINDGAWVDTVYNTNEYGDSFAAAANVGGLFNVGQNTVRHKVGQCIYPVRYVNKLS